MIPRRLVTLLLAICCCTRTTLAYPSGAPNSTCNTMMPIHQGAVAQNSPSPYGIWVSSGSGRLRLIIGSTKGEAYQGFIIMARDVNTGEIVGNFNEPVTNMTRHVHCEGPQSAMTQTKAMDMHNLEFDWEVPEDYEGDIRFNSTILRNFLEFWVGVESPTVSLRKGRIQVHSTTPSPLDYTLVSRSTTPPYYDATPDFTDKLAEDPIYDGCGSNKICFGWPVNCVEERICEAVATVLVEGERYTFEQQTRRGRYVALALSDDDKMGADSVVECVNYNDKVSVHMSWNIRNDKRNKRHSTPSGYINPLSGTIEDGVLKCKYTRDKNTTIEGMNFDLVNKPWHLLLAAGDSARPDNVGGHFEAISSAEPKLLSDVSALTSASDILIRLHGALMMASWIGTASVGMLLARYYRQTWVNSQICGKDQWFAWHRMFMLLTWIMTIAAFILIFIELGEWSSATYHASFGLATTVLCFIQPFMAAMRPHPGAGKRALFNWAHWFVGNAAHICGIIALFFAVGLSKAKLPDWVDWVLVAYVAFHVLTHFFLTFAGCASDKQGSQRVNSFPMKDVHARNSMTHPDARRDAPHAGLRKVTFLIYFLVVALLAAALVLIIVFAPIEESWNTWMKKRSF